METEDHLQQSRIRPITHYHQIEFSTCKFYKQSVKWGSDMSYQALYRVWRPQTFVDVVGQEHVTKTLQNALIRQKISHAYLFSGPRGTGKTSAAKIFAKAVNCEKAPISDPCNECETCRGIIDGSNTDVIEMDAASNNGVEEIRDIRDKVKFAPNSSTYKVYIIDEVHMLTTSAFNALLKTLEEPPKHVIFILATTEPHKLPLTVISRCQRFDFKRITAHDTIKRMKQIAKESQLLFEEQAFEVIARAAEGGLRDALSLLDQAISFSQEKITLEDALTITGSVSQALLNKLAAAIYEQDLASALHSLEQLLMEGKDPTRFTEDFILYYRDMLLHQTAPNLDEALERVMLDEDFKTLAEKIPSEQLYTYIDILNKTQQDMRFSNQGQVYLEVAIVKLCQIEVNKQTIEADQVQQLFAKIQELEKKIMELQEHGVQSNPESKQTSPKKTSRATKSFKPQIGKIREVLREATREELNKIKNSWGMMLEKLNRSQAALLNDAEPVAASANGFVLKFKYDIHCQMAMDNQTFTKTMAEALQAITGNHYVLLGVPEEQWLNIREEFIHQTKDQSSPGGNQEQEEVQEEDPVVAEAIKLVGSKLVEFKE